MNVIDVWVVKTIPSEVLPLDFKLFIENKYEYQDPFGEHIYSLESIWLGCRHIIPPGEILESFNEIRLAMEEEKCDLFTLTTWKSFLGLDYMKEHHIRLLVIDKQSIQTAFLEYIKNKFEYRDP